MTDLKYKDKIDVKDGDGDWQSGFLFVSYVPDGVLCARYEKVFYDIEKHDGTYLFCYEYARKPKDMADSIDGGTFHSIDGKKYKITLIEE